MSKQNILNSDYEKLLFVKLEELADTLARVNVALSKKTDIESAVDNINTNFNTQFSEYLTYFTGWVEELSSKHKEIKDANTSHFDELKSQINSIPIDTYNLLIQKLDEIINAVDSIYVDIDYNTITNNVYDTLIPKFQEVKDLISGLNIDIDIEQIATAVQYKLSNQFTSINDNINALIPIIESSNQGNQGGVNIDTTQLSKLIEGLEFVVSKRKYFEPSEITPSTTPEEVVAYNWRDAIMTNITFNNASKTTMGTLKHHFLTIPGNVYGVVVKFNINTTSAKSITLYLNDELVERVDINPVSYIQLNHNFISSQLMNNVRLEIGYSGTGTLTLTNGKMELIGFNCAFINQLDNYAIERFTDFYYIYRANGTTSQIFRVSATDPVLLPTIVTHTYSRIGYCPLNTYYQRSNSSTNMPTNFVSLNVNFFGEAIFYINNTSNNLGSGFKYGIVLGHQYSGILASIFIALITIDGALVLQSTDGKNVGNYSVIGVPEGKVVCIHPVRDLDYEYTETYMAICALTYEDGNNYLSVLGVEGSEHTTYFIGQGIRWHLGIVRKYHNLNTKTFKVILRSYRKLNNDWIREEFLIVSTNGVVTITLLDSYYVEGTYDNIYVGSDNTYFTEESNALTLREHLPIDYSSILNPNAE